MKKVFLSLAFTASCFAGTMLVYENPACGCCLEWVKYIKAKGYEVKTVQTEDFMKYKKLYNIKEKYQSCHTAVINSKVVEGHVPASVVKWLSSQKDDESILGVSAPGMPQSAPGMDVNDGSSYPVVVMYKDGSYKLFGMYKGDVKLK